MSLLEEKYLAMLSSQLDRFKKKAGKTWNFRCPKCGDSEKSKLKARGYIYEKKGHLWFYCQNCGPGSGRNFSTFLKELNPILHKQFTMEKFEHDQKYNWRTKQPEKSDVVKNTLKAIQNDPLYQLVKISNLQKDHHAVMYCQNRFIPQSFWSILYYSDNFCKWINEFVEKDKFDPKSLPKIDQRIVIPFYDKDGKAFAYQGRAIDKNSSLRYITISPNNDEESLIYGMERIDPNKPIQVVEGPIDSMFLPNGAAAAGSGLKRLMEMKQDKVFIFDNECRSKEIKKLMADIIAANEKIVVWPTQPDKKEDINNMIQKGLTQDEIQAIIDANTFKGLQASLKLAKWSKV